MQQLPGFDIVKGTPLRFANCQNSAVGAERDAGLLGGNFLEECIRPCVPDVGVRSVPMAHRQPFSIGADGGQILVAADPPNSVQSRIVHIVDEQLACSDGRSASKLMPAGTE